MLLRSKILFLLLFITSYIFCNYPEVDLNQGNIIFKQLQTDINENSRRLQLEKEILPLQFFKYKIQKNDTIFSVSSRFNLTYETIATLNKIDNQLFFSSLNEILIPTCPGLFSLKKEEYSKEVTISNELIYFYPGKNFSRKERLSFLVSPFQSPLKSTKITSSYGYRENPFTGKREFHNGLDLKAATGTKIYSPYGGYVKVAGYSQSLGKHLVIQHPMGYTSHFFHLNTIDVKKGDRLLKGDLIGKTGNSGRSTGPHLHFEIRLNDETINPSLLLGNV